jgi:hypothetical protein
MQRNPKHQQTVFEENKEPVEKDAEISNECCCCEAE